MGEIIEAVNRLYPSTLVKWHRKTNSITVHTTYSLLLGAWPRKSDEEQDNRPGCAGSKYTIMQYMSDNKAMALGSSEDTEGAASRLTDRLLGCIVYQ